MLEILLQYLVTMSLFINVGANLFCCFFLLLLFLILRQEFFSVALAVLELAL